MSKIAVPVNNTNPAVPTHFTIDITPVGPSSLTVTPVGNNVFFLSDLGNIYYNDFADNGIETTHIDIPSEKSKARFGLLGNATYNVETFNATPTDLAPINAGSDPKTIYVYGSVEAYSPDLTAGATFSISFCVLTDGSNASIVGSSVVNDFIDAALAGIDVTFDVLNNIFFVIVTGLAATEIHWETTLDYRYVT